MFSMMLMNLMFFGCRTLIYLNLMELGRTDSIIVYLATVMGLVLIIWDFCDLVSIALRSEGKNRGKRGKQGAKVSFQN